MPFSARNARYLRISAHTVLPLYIYLDDKHLTWMSDRILQHVLADLRPDIGPKLRTESSFHGRGGSAKKGSVAVHRGDTYQCAYFFRKNEPHAVLIKSRSFVPAPPPASLKEPIAQSQVSAPTRKKRKRGETGKNKNATTTARHKEGSQRNHEDPAVIGREMASGDAGNSPGGIQGPRRSLRTNNLDSGIYKEVDEQGSDIEMTDSDDQDQDLVPTDRHKQYAEIQDTANLASSTQRTQQPALEEAGPSRSTMALESELGFSQSLDIAEDEEEEKPKMAMKVSYQGFTIYDKCLCVVVEPWPPLREASRVLSRAPSLTHNEMSVPPMEQRGQTPVPLRERTPLFLPEMEPRRSITPAPLPARILPPVPLFDDPSAPEDEGEETDDGMMAFSQVLKSVGGERAGSADEDANEGEVFLGDADDRRGDF